MSKIPKIKDIIRVVAIYDFELPDKTITLPEKIYSECIDTEKIIVVKYPFLLTDNIVKLSDLKVLSTPNMHCCLSLDLCKTMGLNFDADIITILKQK